tara:strand:- start:1855 stop:2013 length:159 start_codon:yes stop_codon:yes gene_type:complete
LLIFGFPQTNGFGFTVAKRWMSSRERVMAGASGFRHVFYGRLSGMTASVALF